MEGLHSPLLCEVMGGLFDQLWPMQHEQSDVGLFWAEALKASMLFATCPSLDPSISLDA